MNLRKLRIALLLYVAFDLFIGGKCGGFLDLDLLAAAQFTTVSGTVTDPNGLPYASGTISAVLVSSASPKFTATNQPYTPPTQPVGLNAAGSFVMQLGDSAALTPAGTTWNFTVNCAAGCVPPVIGKGPITFTVTGITITGASQSITATLTAAAPVLTNTAGGGGTIGGTIASGQVGFGSALNTLAGNANFTFSSTVTGLSVQTSSTTTSTNQGAAFTGIFTGGGTDTQQVGVFGVGENNGSGTVTQLVGVDGAIHNLGAGPVTEGDALLAATNGLEPGPISLFVGVRVQDHTVTGATQSFGELFTNGTNAIGFNGSASGQNLSVTSNNINLGKAPTGGSFNLFLGTGTTGGVTTTTGTNNTCINASNLTCYFSLTSGSFNVAIGQSTLFSVTSGDHNVGIGNNLGSVTTGQHNTAVGAGAQAGGANVSSVSAFGYQALQANQTLEASAFGNQSQNSNTTGLNESFGSLSLLSNTTGTNNDAFGADTLRDNVAGNRNIAMGARTLQSTNGGNDNTGIGNAAGYTATPANANVTGSFNTWIGSLTGPGSATQVNNQTIIGAGTTAVCNNCVVSGTDNTFGTSIINAASPCETAFAPTTLSVAGTTTDTGRNCLPLNAIIDSVVYRITTTITTAANFTVGDSTTAARFCASQSTLTAGTTGICFVQADQTGAAGPRQTAAASVRVTTNVNPGAGAVRLIVYYHTWTAPTS